MTLCEDCYRAVRNAIMVEVNRRYRAKYAAKRALEPRCCPCGTTIEGNVRLCGKCREERHRARTKERIAALKASRPNSHVVRGGEVLSSIRSNLADLYTLCPHLREVQLDR